MFAMQGIRSDFPDQSSLSIKRKSSRVQQPLPSNTAIEEGIT